MTRLEYPKPDRWWLQPIESVKYDIEQIEKVLRLDSDDPSPEGFRSALSYAKHLYELIRVAAISHDRRSYESQD